ncbi:hypothetical protein KI387_011829, partial [Taxus chinensis]
DGECSWDMGKNEEIGIEKQEPISFTKDQITEVAEREEKKMLEALVEKDLERSTNIVLGEGKEENIEKENDSVVGGPALM